jgi:hypothetical protein
MDKRIVALVVCLSFSASAIAQDAEDYSTENGIYISAQGTLMQFIQPLYLVAPPLPNFEDTASAATLLVGYRLLGGKLAFEVGTMNDLTFHETITAVIPNQSLGLELDDNMFRALWRFVGRGDASLIVGAGYHDISYTSSLGGVSQGSTDESETSILIGGEIDGPALTLRFAYEQLMNLEDEARSRAVTFGVGYRF